ncbi:SOUL heme-binding protein [Ferrovum sp. JA12]|uniref:SOUL family heme-binding protein n=1 Tax=Ferrovum sp. JA12 TaxID=1356299 RepID=UPI000715DC33|nr:heme-binding protein [Ferrovum sp. JA12]KRH78237.1 SOUL heme-binding protein [Ferrovum sp. JA12]
MQQLILTEASQRSIQSLKNVPMHEKILFTLLICFTFFRIELVMATEQPSYQVILTQDNFEVRQYSPMLIAETHVSGSMNDASRQGFRTIADYIFGNNHLPNGKDSQKIPMTAPVIVTPQSAKITMTAPVTVTPQDSEHTFTETTSWYVSFVMPQPYTLDNIPQPNNPAVQLKVVPQRYYVVNRYSGFNSESTIQTKINETLHWATQHHYTMVGLPQLARYNPPWTLPMFRRNEILIEIKQPN